MPVLAGLGRPQHGDEAGSEAGLSVEQQALDCDLQMRLLRDLADQRRLACLVHFGAAAGQDPVGAPGTLAMHHEQDALVSNDRSLNTRHALHVVPLLLALERVMNYIKYWQNRPYFPIFSRVS